MAAKSIARLWRLARQAPRTGTLRNGNTQPTITPNGKTVYVLAERGNTATPINVRTGRAGRPIPVGVEPRDIVFTPDSRTGYVVNQGSGTATPINVATNTAGKPTRSARASPAALNTGGDAVVNSVSCAPPHGCAAVGVYADAAGNHQVFVVSKP